MRKTLGRPQRDAHRLCVGGATLLHLKTHNANTIRRVGETWRLQYSTELAFALCHLQLSLSLSLSLFGVLPSPCNNRRGCGDGKVRSPNLMTSKHTCGCGAKCNAMQTFARSALSLVRPQKERHARARSELSPENSSSSSSWLAARRWAAVANCFYFAAAPLLIAPTQTWRRPAIFCVCWLFIRRRANCCWC